MGKFEIEARLRDEFGYKPFVTYDKTRYANVKNKERHVFLYEIAPLCTADFYKSADELKYKIGSELDGYQPVKKARSGYPYNLLPHAEWDICDMLTYLYDKAETNAMYGDVSLIDKLYMNVSSECYVGSREAFNGNPEFEISWIKGCHNDNGNFFGLYHFITGYLKDLSIVKMLEIKHGIEPDFVYQLPAVSFLEAVEEGKPISEWLFPDECASNPEAIQNMRTIQKESVSENGSYLEDISLPENDRGTRETLQMAVQKSGGDISALCFILKSGQVCPSWSFLIPDDEPVFNDDNLPLNEICEKIAVKNPVIVRRAKGELDKESAQAPNHDIIIELAQTYRIIETLVMERESLIAEAEREREKALTANDALSEAKKEADNKLAKANETLAEAAARKAGESKKDRVIAELRQKNKELNKFANEKVAASNKANKSLDEANQKIEMLEALLSEEEDLQEQTLVEEKEKLDDGVIFKENIVFVGGHETVVKHMRERFPDWSYEDGDSPHVRQKLSPQIKMIVAAYEHIGHVTYGTCQTYAKDNKIPLVHVHGSNTENITNIIKNEWEKYYINE